MAWTTHWIGILRHNRKYGHLLGFGLLMWIGLVFSSAAWADPVPVLGQSPLQARIEAFPHWSSLPVTEPAQGDLIYPDWFQGTWQVESTLLDLEAPLAPKIVTPGFEDNRRYLEQPLRFQVRFVPQQQLAQKVPPRSAWQFWRSAWQQSWQRSWQGGWQGKWIQALPQDSQADQAQIVADRAFNGFHIAQAYLEGANPDAIGVEAVLVDPQNPNRQVTTLYQKDQNQEDQIWQLVTIVTDRATESPPNDRCQFITTELSQQFFRSRPQVYLNRVETTTAYHFDPDRQEIHAEQFTAVYLSPQDPQYFQGLDQPVALYHYHLDLQPE